MEIGGQKKPTISALRKRMTRDQRLEAKKKIKEGKGREKGPLPYPVEKEIEGKVWKAVSKMPYVTPYILSEKMKFRLSKGKELLRKFTANGKLVLVEKNGDLEVYKPLIT